MVRKNPRKADTARRPGQQSRPGQRNRVRIIGGTHRGRWISFPDARGLRPTGDRMRETLFNWLAAEVPGSRCLDLFAGSGALGFEAASRGASQVVMLEKSAKVAEQLRANAKAMDFSQVNVQHCDSMRYLREYSAEPFDLVFVDPPFADNILQQVYQLLVPALLRENAMVYVEMDKVQEFSADMSELRPWKEKVSGQVKCQLLSYDPVIVS